MKEFEEIQRSWSEREANPSDFGRHQHGGYLEGALKSVFAFEKRIEGGWIDSG